MGKFFVNDCNFTMEDNFLDELRNLTWEYPEIFTGIEETTNENVVCSIAIFVGDEDVLVVDVCIDDDNNEEFAFVQPWFFDNERWYEFNRAVVADTATAAVQAVISHANTYLGYAFVSDKSVHNSGAAPGEDEGAVQEFLEFVHTSMDVVRIECTALKDPGDWPKIAEFRVESRNDDGGTEIEHWSVQKARV